jgi:DNA-binding NarL/FixJ family response regulator
MQFSSHLLTKGAGVSSAEASEAVLIISDSDILFEGLRAILRRVYPRSTLQRAPSLSSLPYSKGEEQRFALLIYDEQEKLRQDEGDFERLGLKWPLARTVLLTARPLATHAAPPFAHVHGYLHKSLDTETLTAAFRLVAAGGVFACPYFSGEQAAVPPHQAAAVSPAATARAGRSNGTRNLTPRQGEVLRMLAQGYSNKDIANQLGLHPGTVKLHVRAILKALNVANRTAAAKAAWTDGLV